MLHGGQVIVRRLILTEAFLFRDSAQNLIGPLLRGELSGLRAAGELNEDCRVRLLDTDLGDWRSPDFYVPREARADASPVTEPQTTPESAERARLLHDLVERGLLAAESFDAQMSSSLPPRDQWERIEQAGQFLDRGMIDQASFEDQLNSMLPVKMRSRAAEISIRLRLIGADRPRRGVLGVANTRNVVFGSVAVLICSSIVALATAWVMFAPSLDADAFAPLPVIIAVFVAGIAAAMSALCVGLFAGDRCSGCGRRSTLESVMFLPDPMPEAPYRERMVVHEVYRCRVCSAVDAYTAIETKVGHTLSRCIAAEQRRFPESPVIPILKARVGPEVSSKAVSVFFWRCALGLAVIVLSAGLVLVLGLIVYAVFASLCRRKDG